MKNRRIKSFLVVFYMFFMTIVTFAQEIPASSPAVQPDTQEIVAAEVYTIRNVKFLIKGMTMERILRYKADIQPGTPFPDRESLEKYLAERRQILMNERVLADVNIEYTTSPTSSGSYLADITVRTTDSWNIIGLPYFRYDTNDGLLLSLRGRDYNFLGSMRALVLNLDYTRDADGKSSYGGYTSFGIPFKLLNHDAGLDASQSLSVHADDRPITSLSSIGFWMRFPEPGFPLTFSASQGLQFNPEATSTDTDPYFFLSSLSLSAAIPTSLNAGKFGKIYYSPAISTSLYWRPDVIVRNDRKGLTPAFSHSLSFGRVDWIENMRNGLSASISNTLKYNLLTAVDTIDLDASVQFHATSGGKIGFNSRTMGFFSFTDSTRGSLGTNMRGIKTARLWGTEAAFLSLEMPVKLFDFPTHLLIKKNWFDFEMQMSPFLDLGYVGGGSGTTLADKVWYGTGLEFFVYPLRMRTFIVRASLGFDLDAIIKNQSFTEPSPRDGYSPYELYFGLGLFL
ncbi:MAG: hypothetical protein CVV53_03260 [Spirochaetae bacterium HGW-Spirochaetae-9]|nr:MAG: hypothetical protein CVV53_03260 [Spirochaetae bacterium HGW-Spirochaetae-9]